MRRSSATTLQDVAKESGVTAMTVSVVLHGTKSATRVSDATRARIQEAAARLQYRPNAVARALSRRRLDTLGVVAVIDGGEVNHYFLEVLNGILEGAKRHDQNTTIFSVSDWLHDQQRILGFCDGRVDGVIAIAPMFHADFASRLTHQTAVVSIHPNEFANDAFNITTNEESGTYLATQHLISLGHRSIAHMAGPPDMLGARLRYMGFKRAMQDAGLPVKESHVVEVRFSVETGRSGMAELIARFANKPQDFPTAVVCATDAIAYGALETLNSSGLRVPDDVSLIGFDDMILASLTTPQLTTVRQPLREMGAQAVEMLLEQISSDKLASDAPAPPIKAAAEAHGKLKVYDVELVHRGSVAPPRRGGDGVSG
jgi:LacI family transcriptional regulator